MCVGESARRVDERKGAVMCGGQVTGFRVLWWRAWQRIEG